MIIRIEPESEIPIYLQITNQMIEGIAKGMMQPGASLPSVRAFAADLGVNMHTVNKSYHQLEEKGIIRIVPKTGAIINSPGASITESTVARLKEEFTTLVAESLVLGMTKKEIQELVSSITEDFSY